MVWRREEQQQAVAWRATIRLVVAFPLMTYVTRVGGEDVHVACIRTHLISSASAVNSIVPRPEDWMRLLNVVLDCPRPALRCFSVPECWADEATVVLQDYLSSCTSSTPCFLFWPGLTQPVFFLLCCFSGAVRCHVWFYVSHSGSSVVCGVLHGSLREHDCAISTTFEASLRELPHQLPLRFTLGTWLCEIQVQFQIFHNATIVIQRIRMYLRYDVRIHIYRHCLCSTR